MKIKTKDLDEALEMMANIEKKNQEREVRMLHDLLLMRRWKLAKEGQDLKDINKLISYLDDQSI